MDVLKNSVRTKEREDFITVLSLSPLEEKQGFPAHTRIFHPDSADASSILDALEKYDLSKLERLYIPKTDKIGQEINHVIKEEENKGLPEFSLLHIIIPGGTFLARDKNNRPFLLEGSQIDMSSEMTPVTDRIKLFHSIARNTFYEDPDNK